LVYVAIAGEYDDTYEQPDQRYQEEAYARSCGNIPTTRRNDAGLAYRGGLEDLMNTALQFVILLGHARLRGSESR
jgi:hypothetical protein